MVLFLECLVGSLSRGRWWMEASVPYWLKKLTSSSALNVKWAPGAQRRAHTGCEERNEKGRRGREGGVFHHCRVLSSRSAPRTYISGCFYRWGGTALWTRWMTAEGWHTGEAADDHKWDHRALIWIVNVFGFYLGGGAILTWLVKLNENYIYFT